MSIDYSSIDIYFYSIRLLILYVLIYWFYFYFFLNAFLFGGFVYNISLLWIVMENSMTSNNLDMQLIVAAFETLANPTNS